MADDLSCYLHAKRVLIENALRDVLRPGNGCPPALLEAMRYSLLGPGKRLRPLLVVLATEACGGQDRQALAAACAVELVHTYSLIHDDLPAMDDDDLRRGRPTCHKQFGEPLAILAGDALLTFAFELLAESYPPRTGAACCRELARGAGAAGMVGGQVEDLAGEGKLQIANCKLQIANWTAGTEDEGTTADQAEQTLAFLESIHARKTGALFRACLRLGAWVAEGERPEGPEPARLASLDSYGGCFGQAFQITDDLLDVEGSTDQTGKRVGKDAGRGKLTYPGLLGVAASRQQAERLCREACNHLAPFGPAAGRLAALAQSIAGRNR